MNRILLLLFLLAVCLLTSCASKPGLGDKENYLAYRAVSERSRLEQHQPVIIIENPTEMHNRIGTPRATLKDKDEPFIYVDSKRSSVYAEVKHFTTARGFYTNLIYRVHFEKVPFSIIPFHLGWGANVGLIFVVTLNDEEEPVLYTMVHTCGCYLVFVPTSYLPAEALPPKWNIERMKVFGESLPGLLDFRSVNPDETYTAVLVRKDTHRVMDLFLTDNDYLMDFPFEKAPLKPMKLLDHLSVENGGTTSFFEESGPRHGYVKGSVKPMEKLLMSWWALDVRVGEDKKFGGAAYAGPAFYTSLKPWDRAASDMRNFAQFLSYWGWGL